jgi:hypothetical protein
MLVVINPGADDSSRPISYESLRADPMIAPLLDKYVVAIVDGTSDHGLKVHEIFGNQTLPYVSIVDETQKHQLYKVSGSVAPEQLRTVLDLYQDGAPPVTISVAKPYCARCQRQPQPIYYGF